MKTTARQNTAIQHQLMWNGLAFVKLLASPGDQERARDFFICSAAPIFPSGGTGNDLPTSFAVPLSPSVRGVSGGTQQTAVAAVTSSSTRSTSVAKPVAAPLPMADPLDLALPPAIELPQSVSFAAAATATNINSSNVNTSEPGTPNNKNKQRRSVSPEPTVRQTSTPQHQQIPPTVFFVGRKNAVTTTRATRPPFQTKHALQLCPFNNAHFALFGSQQGNNNNNHNNNNSASAAGQNQKSSQQQQSQHKDPSSTASVPATPQAKATQQQQQQQQSRRNRGNSEKQQQQSQRQSSLASADLDLDEDYDEQSQQPTQQQSHPSCLNGSRCDYLHVDPAAMVPVSLSGFTQTLREISVFAPKDRKLFRVNLADAEPTAGLLLLCHLLQREHILSGALRLCSYHTKQQGGCRYKERCLYAHVSKAHLMRLESTNDRPVDANTPLQHIFAMALPQNSALAAAKVFSEVGVKNVGDVQAMSPAVFGALTQDFFERKFAAFEPQPPPQQQQQIPSEDSSTALVTVSSNNVNNNSELLTVQHRANCLLALESLRSLPPATPLGPALMTFHGVTSDVVARFLSSHPAVACVEDLSHVRLRSLLHSTPPVPVPCLSALELLRSRLLADEGESGPKTITLAKLPPDSLYRILARIVCEFRETNAHYSWRKQDSKRPIVTSAMTFVDPARCRCSPENNNSGGGGGAGNNNNAGTASTSGGSANGSASHTVKQRALQQIASSSAAGAAGAGEVLRTSSLSFPSEPPSQTQASAASSPALNINNSSNSGMLVAYSGQAGMGGSNDSVGGSGGGLSPPTSSGTTNTVPPGQVVAASCGGSSSNNGALFPAQPPQPPFTTTTTTTQQQPPYFPDFASCGKFNLPAPVGHWCQCPRAYHIGVNFELSTPTGSRCSEQVVMGKIASSGFPTSCLRELFVHGRGVIGADGRVIEDPNPLFICGVCEAQMRRLSKDVQQKTGGGDIDLLMFDATDNPKRLVYMSIREVSHRAGSSFKRFVEEELRGSDIDD